MKTHQKSGNQLRKPRLVVEWFLSLLLSGLLYLITLAGVILILLPLYTRHGKETEVPYVIGIDKKEACKEIEEAHLICQIQGKGDTVIRTLPEPGSIVKIGKKIKVVVK